MKNILKSSSSPRANSSFKYFCAAACVLAFAASFFAFRVDYFERTRFEETGGEIAAKTKRPKNRRVPPAKPAGERKAAAGAGKAVSDQKSDFDHRKLWFVLDFDETDSQ